MQRVCKECGKTFELTQGEIHFYQSKKLALPKRCEECRNRQKQRKETDLDKKASSQSTDSSRKTVQSEGRGRETAQSNQDGRKVMQSEDRSRETAQSNQNSRKTVQSRQSAAPDKSVTKNLQAGTAGSEKGLRKRSPIVALIAAVIVAVAGFFGSELPGQETQKKNEAVSVGNETDGSRYEFRSDEYLEDHFEKHGGDFDYNTMEEYEAGANAVIQDPDVLHKTEAEDGDDVYYLEDTNEFVIVSTDGYLRTYFKPEDGIAYYERQ